VETDLQIARDVCYRLYSDPSLSLNELARQLSWGASHLQMTFTKTVGVSPKKFADAVRLLDVREGLLAGETVTDAVASARYGSTRGFYQHASIRLGVLPSSLRTGSESESIETATVESSLGTVVIATTARGLCAVRIGSTESELLSELKTEFPKATFHNDVAAVRPLAIAASALLLGVDHRLLDRVDLDIAGTALQSQVWEAIRTIPFGQTRTYSEVAEQIGKPAAVRAVATACGRNPVALVVPCQRVLRRDGELGGYRWGLTVKQDLLNNETAFAAISN